MEASDYCGPRCSFAAENRDVRQDLCIVCSIRYIFTFLLIDLSSTVEVSHPRVAHRSVPMHVHLGATTKVIA